MTDSHIDRYAVFGNPIAHSKSPQIHTLFAEQTAQTLQYTAELAEIGDFDNAVWQFFKTNGKGLNITVPFKEDAWALADRHSQRALRAGAVNTLSLQPNGTIYGDTTDGIGLATDLVKNHQINLKNTSILVIGAGGAVRGVLEALLNHSPASLTVANRTKEKAMQLATDFADLGNIMGCGLDDLNHQKFDVIINGTSTSLQGDLPAIPNTIFNADACSYDMMYGADQTPFMIWSSKHGATQVFDGLGMLVEQAAESFFIWRGKRPETQSVIQNIRASLKQS